MILQGLTFSCHSFQIGYLLLNDLVNKTSCRVCRLSGIPAPFTLKIRFHGAKEFSSPAGLEIFGDSIHFQ